MRVRHLITATAVAMLIFIPPVRAEPAVPPGPQRAVLQLGAAVDTRQGRVAVDPAGNRLVRVGPRGRVHTLARFPSRVLPAGTPGAVPVVLESTPSSIVRGPDSAYYVGERTSFPAGQARIWRVAPGRAPAVLATGFTAVAGLAWGPGRELYVLQTTPRPALLRIGWYGAHRRIATPGLVAPTALAIRGSTAHITDAGGVERRYSLGGQPEAQPGYARGGQRAGGRPGQLVPHAGGQLVGERA